MSSTGQGYLNHLEYCIYVKIYVAQLFTVYRPLLLNINQVSKYQKWLYVSKLEEAS